MNKCLKEKTFKYTFKIHHHSVPLCLNSKKGNDGILYKSVLNKKVFIDG